MTQYALRAAYMSLADEDSDSVLTISHTQQNSSKSIGFVDSALMPFERWYMHVHQVRTE